MPRGGARPGAGARPGNLNGLRHGRYCRNLALRHALQLLSSRTGEVPHALVEALKRKPHLAATLVRIIDRITEAQATPADTDRPPSG